MTTTDPTRAMVEDVSRRLRTVAHDLGDGYYFGHAHVMLEAADLIDRLAAAPERIRSDALDELAEMDADLLDDTDPHPVARAAVLGEAAIGDVGGRRLGVEGHFLASGDEG